MSGWRGFQDERRATLRLSGSDARAFLQGLVTNDVDRLAAERPVYAAMLSPQGKYLFDFHIFDAAPLGDDGALLLDVAADRHAALAKRLNMYRLRRDVEISIPEPAYGVALAWGGDPEKIEPCGAKTMAAADSRDAALGVRIISADPVAALDALGAAKAGEGEYDALRVTLSAPESGAELVPEDSYILENRFEALNGVDFRKGCYVGQEVTARMKHKTELRKGLVRVSVVGGAPAPGAEITVDGKPAGRLGTVAEGAGLAHVRFDRARVGEMRAGDAVLTLID